MKMESKEFKAAQHRHIQHLFGCKKHPDIKYIPVSISGDFEVDVDYHVTVTIEDVTNDFYYNILLHKGIEITDNNPLNFKARHRWIIDNAHGNIAVFGLGLGDSLHYLLQQEKVRNIDVFEKESDVITLVVPKFKDSKVSFYQGDAYNVELTKEYDCIYCAIWNVTPSKDDIDTLTKKHALNSKGQIGFIYC
ncbi:MAG: hypothetical protein HQK65_16085 [Desulfamplus sp.]|nr:hypothetical protein [Desulfamplus sp.]